MVINTEECKYPSRLVNGEETNRDRIIWLEGYDTGYVAHEKHSTKRYELLCNLVSSDFKEMENLDAEILQLKDQIKQLQGK